MPVDQATINAAIGPLLDDGATKDQIAAALDTLVLTRATESALSQLPAAPNGFDGSTSAALLGVFANLRDLPQIPPAPAIKSAMDALYAAATDSGTSEDAWHRALIALGATAMAVGWTPPQQG